MYLYNYVDTYASIYIAVVHRQIYIRKFNKTKCLDTSCYLPLMLNFFTPMFTKMIKLYTYMHT